MKRAAFGLLLAFTATAQSPRPIRAPCRRSSTPAWQAKTRAVFKQAIEIPSVHNRGANASGWPHLLADQFRAAGIPDADIHVMPYEALPGDKTVALIVRWRSARTRRRSRCWSSATWMWSRPSATTGNSTRSCSARKDGYFYGRGTSDMKNGDVATTMAAVKLMSEGFKPDRDIIFFYSGDEETQGRGATLGATEWRNLTDAEFGLNADGGCTLVRRKFRPLGCGISTAEKTFQTYFLTTHNPGGHSSRPRPDNAIYDLADALEKAAHAPLHADAERHHPRLFRAARASRKGTARSASDIRAWLANPNDGAAADAIEASPLEVGLTRTRCVATMLSGGHADNALPQSATATVNCRILPGVEPSGPGRAASSWSGPRSR